MMLVLCKRDNHSMFAYFWIIKSRWSGINLIYIFHIQMFLYTITYYRLRGFFSSLYIFQFFSKIRVHTYGGSNIIIHFIFLYFFYISRFSRSFGLKKLISLNFFRVDF